MALETVRLRIRPLVADDGPFIVRLFNDPSFLEYIGDRGLRTAEEARVYIEEGPMESRTRLGFALDLVEERLTGEPVGICGLVKRPALDDPDLGFAYLPPWRGRGYAREAAEAVIDDATARLGLKGLAAVVDGRNGPSIALLTRLGFHRRGTVRLVDDGPLLELYGLVIDKA
jgi:RimJ/RimL family protein N-acetyltransferase